MMISQASSGEKDKAEEEFVTLRGAYEILSDKSRREKYDAVASFGAQVDASGCALVCAPKLAV